MDKPNVKIEYLYRDRDNYKVHNEAVVAGPFNSADADRIMASLFDGENFLPAQVGLPEVRFDRFDPESDGPWFELYRTGFIPTAEEPMCNVTFPELADRFERMRGRWEDALDEDYREVGHSILDRGGPDAGATSGDGGAPSTTVKILLTCPNCGDSNWIRREDGFECAACGDCYETEDMCATASDDQS